jgi:predicted 3-demethylubiquinone-9 3-methyltransferase (glyoxalase superfamily)
MLKAAFSSGAISSVDVYIASLSAAAQKLCLYCEVPGQKVAGENHDLNAEPKVRPFLMFDGKAWCAPRGRSVAFYVSPIPGAKQPELSVMAPVSPVRREPRCGRRSQSRAKASCALTASSNTISLLRLAISLFADCASEDEIRRLSLALSTGGSVFMPLGNYGFSRLQVPAGLQPYIEREAREN